MPTNSTSLRGDYHTAHARGTIKSRNIIEFPFFFSLSFSKRVKLPVKGQLLAALACGCLAPARALCWTQLGSQSSRCWPWGWRRERGHGPKQAVGTGMYRQLGENASISSESGLLLHQAVRWNRFCGPPYSLLFSQCFWYKKIRLVLYKT